MDRKRRHRISHLIFRITGILFLALVLGLSLVNYLLPDREFSEQENRMLAQKPQPYWRHIFPKVCLQLHSIQSSYHQAAAGKAL